MSISEEHLPTGFTQIIYGIPVGANSLRDRIREIVKAHGLWSIDIGGSVYLGMKNPKMDDELNQVLAKLEEEVKAKMIKGFSFRVFAGDFDQATAAFFKDRIVANVLGEMDLVEGSIDQLEKALAGEVQIVDEKTGKDRNLATLGESRIRDAKKLLEGMDAVTERFQGSLAAELEGDRIRRRVAQVRAWVERVETGHKRFVAVQKARAAKDAKQEAEA